MDLKKLALSGLIGYSLFAGGCDNYQKEIERMRECRRSTHDIYGKVIETDYDESFIDGIKFSFIVKTEEYGTKRFIGENNSMGTNKTAANLYEKVLTGDKVKITLSTCADMNARNIDIDSSRRVRIISE